ncbi:MAG: nucleotidyl transferase AbiEii/AbiGii toxin family protein [Chitinivibrionales bacterium]|nr:nucleotidyl transferase AbiEii/AbiGii toxin family protein [Chitinivibrionales bacterium]
MKDISASVRARLLNLSKSTMRDFQELTIRYAVERFLARLAQSKYRDEFILKGAMLYIPWKLEDTRTTMDLDLLGFGNPDLENMKSVFQSICTTKIEDDGLTFIKDSITVNQIREESVYDGVRVIIQVKLGTMSIRLQVDVGFGDKVVPAPLNAEFPAIFAEQGPIIRLYSPETVIAEKFNAMVVLGMANSRMKDYYDIWILSRSFCFDSDTLGEAILQTFHKRQTVLPKIEPLGLSDDFVSNASKQTQWTGFIRKQKRLELTPQLAEIVKQIKVFILPIVAEIHTESPTIKKWNFEQGWILYK